MASTDAGRSWASPLPSAGHASGRFTRYRAAMLGIQRPSRWLPLAATLAWAGVIFYLSSRSDMALTEDPLWDFLTRKAAHAFVFGVLAFLAAATARAFELPSPALVGLVVAVVYGALDEVHQGFVPGRSPQLRDVLVDAAGALVGAAAWWWLDRRAQTR